MPAAKRANNTKLPGKFEELVRIMPPQAIKDDARYADATSMIDRLMAVERLTRGQELYMETLVQLVQAYESAHHAIALPSGMDALRHLMAEHGLNASALARVLGVHESMGSKILGESARSPSITSGPSRLASRSAPKSSWLPRGPSEQGRLQRPPRGHASRELATSGVSPEARDNASAALRVRHPRHHPRRRRQCPHRASGKLAVEGSVRITPTMRSAATQGRRR